MAIQLLSPGAVFAAWIVALIPYGVYCRVRPIGGMDCFLAFAGPVWSAWVVYLISGLPLRAAAALMLALGLIALIAIDREDRHVLEAGT